MLAPGTACEWPLTIPGVMYRRVGRIVRGLEKIREGPGLVRREQRSPNMKSHMFFKDLEVTIERRWTCSVL